MLINKNIDFEARTTVHSELTDVDDINTIMLDLKQRGYNKTYYIQEFLDTGTNIGELSAPKHGLDRSLILDTLNLEFR